MCIRNKDLSPLLHIFDLIVCQIRKSQPLNEQKIDAIGG